MDRIISSCALRRHLVERRVCYQRVQPNTFIKNTFFHLPFRIDTTMLGLESSGGAGYTCDLRARKSILARPNWSRPGSSQLVMFRDTKSNPLTAERITSSR